MAIDLATGLAQQRRHHLYRSRRTVDGAQDVELNCNGKPLLSFCSNDYLGLANHQKLVMAMQHGAERYGVGSGASHLVTGHGRAHHELEEALAQFTGRPRTLLFSAGYMANLGVISALATRHDTIHEDRLNHASLIDAARLSDATLRRYPHCNPVALGRHLEKQPDGQRFVVTDGVFSMDGDIAPLPQLAAFAQQHDAMLMVDDAHGLGVIGETGRGCVEHFGLTNDEVPVLIGTLGKAFGTFGAFVAGSDDLIETLIQRARTYIYTTALPPAVAHTTLASIKLIDEEHWRREQLQAVIERFRNGAQQLDLNLMESTTPIQPLIIGDSEKALRISQELLAHDILISAIRPPTVPEDTARLRITFSANHTEEQVDRLLAALERVATRDAA